MSRSRAIVDNTITTNTTSDIVLPIRAAGTTKAASAESTSETTTEYFRGYPLNLKALLTKRGEFFMKKVEFQRRIVRRTEFLSSVRVCRIRKGS